jgi:uncharacterized membrane protein YgcG
LEDFMAGRILDKAVLPLFREDNFSGGLLQGAQAIAAAVAKDKGMMPGALSLPILRIKAPAWKFSSRKLYKTI